MVSSCVIWRIQSPSMPILVLFLVSFFDSVAIFQFSILWRGPKKGLGKSLNQSVVGWKGWANWWNTTEHCPSARTVWHAGWEGIQQRRTNDILTSGVLSALNQKQSWAWNISELSENRKQGLISKRESTSNPEIINLRIRAFRNITLPS